MMKKEEKICLVVKAFLEHPNYTMTQLAELQELKGISKSSIQRYLNDPLIINLLGIETYNQIQTLLKKNLLGAKQKGGINSFKNNEQVKDEKGRFVTSIKNDDPSKVERKIRHILTFSEIFLNHLSMTLQEIADFYNKTNTYGEVVTRDYVYDCLTNRQTYGVLSDSICNQISTQLEQRRLQGNSNGANVTNEMRKK